MPELDVPLRFFVTAPLFGMAAGLLLAIGGAPVLTTPWHPLTLAATHLVTLGLLTTAMLGALYQLFPVVIGSEVPALAASRWLHAGWTLGVALLVIGLGAVLPALTGSGAALLALTLPALLVQQVTALLRAPGANIVRWFLALAVVALAGTAALGLLFALGHAGGGWVLPRAPAITVHLYWGFGGWFGALLAGVSSVVLPMFYVVPTPPHRQWWLVWALLALLLLVAPVAAALGGRWLWAPLAVAVAVLVAYGTGVLRLLAKRRRKRVDATLRCWRFGLACSLPAVGAAALALAGVRAWSAAGGGVAPGTAEQWLLATAVLFLLGFAASILAGMLNRVVPFLVWMHRFGHLAGKTPIPMLTDLLPRPAMQRQLRLHIAAVLLLTAAALWPADALVRLGGVALLLSTGQLWRNVVHAARQRPSAEQLAAAGASAPPGPPQASAAP